MSRRSRTLVCLLLGCPCLSGCATLICIACEPVTVPLSLFNNYQSEKWPWVAAPFLLPLAFILAPLTGVAAELDFLENGDYRSIRWVFDPIAHLPGH